MQRAVTAIYRSRQVADLVRDELERLGIQRHDITVLPDASVVPDTTDPSRSTARTHDDLDDSFDRLHDLHLPEEDARTYQQALRNGDHVVSVDLDDKADLGRVEEVMRRPEDAYHVDELGARFRDADYVPRRQPMGEGYDERMVGRREDNQLSPYTRTYRRDLPLVPSALALRGFGTR